MKKLLVFVAALATCPVLASDEWQLVWVTHDAGWNTNRGHGTLKRSGNLLEGTLVADDDGRADYKLRIELSGDKASGTFEVISERGGAAQLKGSYRKWAHAAKHCPEQIQLVNDSTYVGLARNACQD